MTLSVTTAHAGNLVSVGFLLWSSEAAASEQRLQYTQRGGGFAEGEGPSEGAGSLLGASRWAAGFVQVQLFLNPSGQNGLALMCLLFVCLFTYFSGLRSL